MSGSAGGQDEPVGYGKPPRSKRFRKGQSGNPLGRPRKQKSSAPLLPAVNPTTRTFEKVAQKPVRVREGEEVFEVSVTEAVVQGVAKRAMAGSPMAARIYLDYQMAIDRAKEAKLQERFTFWKDYVQKHRVAIAVAERKGEPLPEPIPHPDEIEFDPVELNVRFTGPVSVKEVEKFRHEARLGFLALEIMLYQGTPEPDCMLNPGPEIDIFAFMFLVQLSSVPLRFRKRLPEDQLAAEKRIRMRQGMRRAALREYAASLGLPLDPDRRPPKLDLRTLDLRIRDGQLEHYRWPKVEAD